MCTVTFRNEGVWNKTQDEGKNKERKMAFAGTCNELRSSPVEHLLQRKINTDVVKQHFNGSCVWLYNIKILSV